jgi:hypothetical protein
MTKKIFCILNNKMIIFFLTQFIILSLTTSVKIELTKNINKGSDAVTTEIPKFTVSMFNTGYQANDIGVGPEGQVHIVGTSGQIFQYNFLTNMYKEIEGSPNLPTAARIDTDADGTPYVTTSSGQVYYQNCQNHWVQLPGCGTDIGVGRGGEVWKIGCDERAGGYGIWKLHCKCKCKCNCERSCLRFRSMYYNNANLAHDEKKCFWYRIEGGAVRVDVHPDGNPWVLTNDGVVYGYDGVNWQRVNGVLGRDITVSNDGMAIVAGLDAKIYALHNPSTSSWVEVSGSALEISAGPFSQSWQVAVDHYVTTSAKFDYN